MRDGVGARADGIPLRGDEGEEERLCRGCLATPSATELNRAQPSEDLEAPLVGAHPTGDQEAVDDHPHADEAPTDDSQVEIDAGKYPTESGKQTGTVNPPAERNTRGVSRTRAERGEGTDRRGRRCKTLDPVGDLVGSQVISHVAETKCQEILPLRVCNWPRSICGSAE